MRDLNRRVRHAMARGAEAGRTRVEAELLGFRAYFEFAARNGALYRIIRQAEFVSPQTLHEHYDAIASGYVAALESAMDSGEVRRMDPQVLAWALMGMGELLGMRWIVWEDARRSAARAAAGDAGADRAGDGRVTRVSLAATASYLPERWMPAAEVAVASGVPEQVLVEKFALARQAHRGDRRARQRHVGARVRGAARRGGRRSGVDRRRHVLRLDVEGLRGLAGGAVDRAPHRRDERVRGRVRQRVVRHARGAAAGEGHARRGAGPSQRPARRRVPRVVPARLRERALALHVQLRRRRRGRAARQGRRAERAARLARPDGRLAVAAGEGRTRRQRAHGRRLSVPRRRRSRGDEGAARRLEPAQLRARRRRGAGALGSRARATSRSSARCT